MTLLRVRNAFLKGVYEVGVARARAQKLKKMIGVPVGIFCRLVLKFVCLICSNNFCSVSSESCSTERFMYVFFFSFTY